MRNNAMMYTQRVLFLVLIVLPIKSLLAWEVSGYSGIESLGFWEPPLESQQQSHYLSGVIEAEFYHEWNDGRDSLVFVPFFRWSEHDDQRTHFDIRELNWVTVADLWELRVGIRKEFWGVTESQHLVDIINQTDRVENSDTEDKLGQPMINLALIDPQGGTLDLFLLTGFREAVGAVRVLNNEVQITTGNPIQIISEFINTGEDVPVRAMTLVETYRRLKTA